MELKRSVSMGEMIGFSITILGAFLYFYVSTNVRLSALEINAKNQSENVYETKESFKSINTKLDKLNEGQSEIKITLQNKQDRK